MLKLADIFKSGMVLQRQKDILVWGQSNIPQRIAVSINGAEVAQGDFQAGTWKLHIPAMEASEDQDHCSQRIVW